MKCDTGVKRALPVPVEDATVDQLQKAGYTVELSMTKNPIQPMGYDEAILKIGNDLKAKVDAINKNPEVEHDLGMKQVAGALATVYKKKRREVLSDLCSIVTCVGAGE